jgi:hypothetical protein
MAQTAEPEDEGVFRRDRSGALGADPPPLFHGNLVREGITRSSARSRPPLRNTFGGKANSTR